MSECFESMEGFKKWRDDKEVIPSSLIFNLVEGSSLTTENVQEIFTLLKDSNLENNQIEIYFMVDTIEKVEFLANSAQKPDNRITKCVQFFGQDEIFTQDAAFPCIKFVIKKDTTTTQTVAGSQTHLAKEIPYRSQMADINSAFLFLNDLSFNNKINIVTLID